ncbi:MAG: hypothetical protein HY811_07275 [Planctomycetes bacterium]|nr:hypothetical protein [Planctomycetota bacterium]
MEPDKREEIWVSASEINEFFYCPHAWWLRRTGVISADLELLHKGEVFHAHQQDNVKKEQSYSRWSVAFLIIGLSSLLAFIILLMLK